MRKLTHDASPLLNIDRVRLVNKSADGLGSLELDNTAAVVYFGEGTDPKDVAAAVFKLNYDISAGKVVFHVVVDGVAQDVVAVDKVYIEVVEDKGGHGAASVGQAPSTPPMSVTAYKPARNKSQAGTSTTAVATAATSDGGDPADDSASTTIIIGVLCGAVTLVAVAFAAFCFGRATTVRQGNRNRNRNRNGMRTPGVTVTNQAFAAFAAYDTVGMGVHDSTTDAPPSYDSMQDATTVYTNVKVGGPTDDGEYASVDAPTPATAQQDASYAEVADEAAYVEPTPLAASEATCAGFDAPEAIYLQPGEAAFMPAAPAADPARAAENTTAAVGEPRRGKGFARQGSILRGFDNSTAEA